jgi:hypothetical protein
MVSWKQASRVIAKDDNDSMTLLELPQVPAYSQRAKLSGPAAFLGLGTALCLGTALDTLNLAFRG